MPFPSCSAERFQHNKFCRCIHPSFQILFLPTCEHAQERVMPRSPYPQRVFQSRYEENQAIEALLPLLNTRRQQLLVRTTFPAHSQMKLSQLKSLHDLHNSTLDASTLGYSSVIHLSVGEEDESQVWQDLELIDTVLLRAYVRTNRPAIIPFLRNENFVRFEDAQQLLAGAGMEPELITLYSTHHKHDLVRHRPLLNLRPSPRSSSHCATHHSPRRSANSV